MRDGSSPFLTDKIAALSALAASLLATGGPHYAAMAQLSRLAEDIVDMSAEGDPLSAAIAGSLFRVLSYPLHDHPQFNALIAVHAFALDHAVKDGMSADSARGVELMRQIEAAVSRIVPAEAASVQR